MPLDYQYLTIVDQFADIMNHRFGHDMAWNFSVFCRDTRLHALKRLSEALLMDTGAPQRESEGPITGFTMVVAYPPRRG